MNPKALEALRQARALFAEKADDIPKDAQPVPPLRKPQVHLIPTNAPKFTKETMKQEHKVESKAEGMARVLQENGHSLPQQIDEYVEMSVVQAVKKAMAKGITGAANLSKETGKNVNQVYTALWKVKQEKKKANQKARAERLAKQPTPKQQLKDEWDRFGVNTTNSFNTPPSDWDREPTPFEDAHYVVLRNREDYEKEIDRICEERNALATENQELKTIIKYLEGRTK